MFLTKKAILNDYEFVKNLAKIIYEKYGVEGFKTIVTDLDNSLGGSSDVALSLLNDKLFFNTANNDKLEEYSSKLLLHIANSEHREELARKLADLINPHVEINLDNRADRQISQFLLDLDKNDLKDEILEKLSNMLETHRVTVKKNSPLPWVEVVGEYYDEEAKRMKISFDWNDAFIALLRTKGYPGEDEDELVQLWLQEIANQK